jgi:uncharacterized protein with FMN-binding domain
MESKYNMQKKIGIFIGFVVVLGVLYVNMAWGKQPSATPVSAPLLNQSTPVTSTKSKVAAKVTSKNSKDEDNSSDDSDDINHSQTSTVQTPPPAIAPKKSVSVYKNGTYSATGSYMSPGGMDQISVTLTLSNSIITNISVTPQAGDRLSQKFQTMFIAGYQQYVLGKNISTVNLSKVSGSSLTPQGFNDALTQIKAQAAA